MSDEINKSEPLEALERTLAGFTPALPRIERDRLMFLAGRASAEGSGFGVQGSESKEQGIGIRKQGLGTWVWPAATAALGVTAAGLTMALLLRQEPRVVIVERGAPVSQQAVAQRETAAAAEIFNGAVALRREPAASRVPADNYLRTREVALRMGLDAIGSQQAAAGLAAPQTYGDLLLLLAGSRQTSEGATERRDNLSNM